MNTPTNSFEDLYRFTVRIQMVLHRLTCAGAFVDQTYLTQIKEGTEREVLRIKDQLSKAAIVAGMPEFEPDNDNHLRTLLFEKLSLPVLERTRKTKEPSVTKDVLKLLAEQSPPEAKKVLEGLVEYSAAAKIYSTYVLNLVGTEEEEGILFPLGAWGDGPAAWLPFQFRTLGAKTGRRSSGGDEGVKSTNSQNWPKYARKLIRSRWPGGMILECDYRKLEPRIIACLAKSQKLLEFFTTGGGYIDIAKILFRTDVKEGTVLYRGVKSIVLGVHYDMQTDKMAYNLWGQGIRFSEDYDEHWNVTDRIRHAYLDAFPEIGNYMERRRAELAATGCVKSPTGRLRRLGTSTDKHSANQAINFPVQSTAGDITGAALIDVEAAILREFGLSYVEWYDLLLSTRKKLLTRSFNCDTIGVGSVDYAIPTLFNEVHDSLLVDLPPDLVVRSTELVVETMRAVPTFRAMCPYLKDIPLDVDIKCAPRWGG